MLTGKAKLDFEKWVKSICPDGEVWCIAVGCDNGYNYIEDLYDSDGNRHRLLMSLIIDWFETVGISVETFAYLKTKKTFKYGCDIIATFDIHEDSSVWNSGLFFKRKNEALYLAINKANEIYNASQDALKIETV